MCDEQLHIILNSCFVIVSFIPHLSIDIYIFKSLIMRDVKRKLQKTIPLPFLICT